MNRDQLTGIAEADLVERFAELARDTGAAVLNSEVAAANRALSSMWAIEDELRSRGPEARLKMAPLLDNKDRFVRYYAAQALLGLVPERARAVIEWNADFGFDAIAGDAHGLLRALDSGEYKPD